MFGLAYIDFASIANLEFRLGEKLKGDLQKSPVVFFKLIPITFRAKAFQWFEVDESTT